MKQHHAVTQAVELTNARLGVDAVARVHTLVTMLELPPICLRDAYQQESIPRHAAPKHALLAHDRAG